MYSNLNKYLFNRLHKIQMTAARAVIGNYCFKKSTDYILNKCKWLKMKDLIMYRCLSYIHGVIENKKPKCIYQIYRQNRFERHKAELTCVNLPKGKKYSTFFLYSQTQNYNKIPIEIKEKSSVNFKKELRMWIRTLPDDTMD